MLRSRIRILASLPVLVALLTMGAPRASAGSAPRVLPGHVPDAVALGRAKLLGHHNPDDLIRLAISLPLRDAPGLDQFLQQVGDPASPSYHHFLSQAEANQSFNPTPDQEQRVITWLQGHGLAITGTYPNHLLVDAQGTFGQVEGLLHITLNDYRQTIHGHDRTFYAPANDPTIDATVSDVVDSISGLTSYPRFQILTNGTADGWPPYFPQDFANAYDVTPLWNAGYDGTGQHIGIIMWTVPPSSSTLQHFGSVTGASVPTTANGKLTVIAVDGGTTNQASPDTGEAGMDIESASGLAPGASIDYYEAPTDSSGNPTDQGLLDALNLAGTAARNDLQISNSWGGCEASSASDPWTVAAEKIFAASAATGHTYFFASGDNGSWCDPTGNGIGQDPYPDYPASSAYVTSVGGNAFSNAINGRYPGETAWAYCATCNNSPPDYNSPEGSGGGYSTIFSRPSWQTGNGLAANGKRGYPDISAVGDPNTGAYVCYGDSSACGQIGGTSLSTPLWAGMTAVLNQYLTAQGKPVAGFLNPSLYKLATTSQTYAPFHDITSGTNGQYRAGAGWDAVTGEGSPDLYNLARDLAGVTSGPPTTTCGTGSSVTIQAGTGWNLAGGSPLTLWSDASVTWAWNAATGQWYHPTGSAPCGTGTWEDVSTAGPRTVTVWSCSSPISVAVVAHRWNLVGNPCSTRVTLPGTARAYWWDPSATHYDLVTSINPGAAAWVKPNITPLILSP